MALIYIFIVLISGLLNSTTANPLMIVEKKSECGKNPTKQCLKAAIIRGPTHIGLPAVCYNRVDPGPCGRDLIRVYYDKKSNRCKHFSYSGCGGNANRFISIKNCYLICNPGYRTRLMVHNTQISEASKPKTITVADLNFNVKPKKMVKLNVTEVHQIQVEI